jgi:predicted enzyme related to lactoylglutathione lyase
MKYEHGTIAWTELLTGDVARQRAFYASLFGWVFDVEHRARAAESGKVVAALRAGKGGWAPFIAVDDVSAARQVAFDAGGKAREGGGLEDPSGGVFFLRDGAPLDGADGLNAPGGLAWNEMWSPDVSTSVAFYRAVIGWNLKDAPGFGGATYTMFAGRDRPSWTHAGVRTLGTGPSRWMSYFEVIDCKHTAELASSLGARVTMPPTNVKGVGWLATFEDLDGNWFGSMQSERSV